MEDGEFERPTSLFFKPNSDNVMYVLEQDGIISRMELENGELNIQKFVDLRDYYNVVYTPEGPGSCHECGLYSMAFHPDFDDNGYIYISFTVDGSDGAPLQCHIVRLRSAEDGLSLAEDGAGLENKEIYQIQQPSIIHNNGKENSAQTDFCM